MPHIRRGLLHGAVMIGSMVLVVGCWPAQNIPEQQREPDTVGIVASQVYSPDVGLVVTLEDGQVLTFPDWRAAALNGSVPRVGDLLMAGTTDGQQWAISIYPAAPGQAKPPGCFRLPTSGKDDGSSIVTALGLRLDRAPDFKQGWGQDGLYDDTRGGTDICLDAEGVATSWGV